jgi:hypothetical protein
MRRRVAGARLVLGRPRLRRRCGTAPQHTNHVERWTASGQGALVQIPIRSVPGGEFLGWWEEVEDWVCGG